MRNFFLTFIIVWSLFDSILAQNNFEAKVELGLNVSNVLAATFNVQRVKELNDPVTLLMKFRMAKGNFLRAGGLIDFDSKTDFISFDILETKTRKYGAKLGFEHRRSILKNLYVPFGLDGIITKDYSHSQVQFRNPSETAVTEFSKLTYGAGAFVGLMYRVNKYFYISVESALWMYYSREKDKFIDGHVLIRDLSYDKASIKHLLPESIYLYIGF